MYEAKPSRTAMGAAEARATYRLLQPPPWVLDDPYAMAFIANEYDKLARESRDMAPRNIMDEGRAGVAVRTRYAEDRVLDGHHTQYVLLGAGLDSFAWRHRDSLGDLRVFEVDHPATQAWKRRRVADLDLPTLSGHIFAPVDFENETLADRLDAAGFDWSQRTVFSCVGVAMYLTPEALEDTLRTVARCMQGSEIVLGYNQVPDHIDDNGRLFLEAVRKRVGAMNEPLLSAMAPDSAEDVFRRCGLTVAAHPTPDEHAERYGIRPYSLERLVVGATP